MNDQLKKLIESGIPLSRVVFQSSVDNADRVPSNYYAEDSGRPDRRAEMWLTPNYLFCKQKALSGEYVIFGTSAANVKDFRVKEIPQEIPKISIEYPQSVDPTHTVITTDPATFVRPEYDFSAAEAAHKPKRGRPFKNDTSNNGVK